MTATRGATFGLVATDLSTAEQAGIFDLLELTHRRTNPSTRFYPNKARNARDLYRALVRWSKSDRVAGFTDWHRITHGQLVHERKGRESCQDEGMKAAASQRRMLVYLEAAELIEWRTAADHQSLEFRLLPVPALPRSVFSGAPAGVAQSVRAAES